MKVSVPLRGLCSYKVMQNRRVCFKLLKRFQSPCGDYALIRDPESDFNNWCIDHVSVPLRGLCSYKETWGPWSSPASTCVSVPLRGLCSYKSASYQRLNHAGSKPGFRGTPLRSLDFCDNFFHNIREPAYLLMRGGFSTFGLLYAYSIPRKDGLIKAFIGIFSEKKSG